MGKRLLLLLIAGASIALLIGPALRAVEAGEALVSALWFAAIFVVAIGAGIVEMRLGGGMRR
ncbi:MAG TPA: hypothetical protein VEW25_13995 [Allosphingosinicella sp.]|nr:hypothetical protein [Allosphingosinicella sp.]